MICFLKESLPYSMSLSNAWIQQRKGENPGDRLTNASAPSGAWIERPLGLESFNLASDPEPLFPSCVTLDKSHYQLGAQVSSQAKLRYLVMFTEVALVGFVLGL